MSELTKSLVKFQAEIKPIAKDMKNSYFNSKYATLSAVLEDVLPVLTKNDLAITQTFKHFPDSGVNFLVTKLLHSSGESIESEFPMQLMPDIQKMGSQITYIKRYSLMAILGVSASDEDDDGNAVVKYEHKNIDYKKKDTQIAQIKTELAKKTTGLTTEQKQKFLSDNLKVQSFKDVEKMSNDELVNLFNKLQGTILK